MIRASLVVLTLVAVAPAWADKAKAVKLADEGNQASAAGDFKTAAARYTEAYKEDPSRIDVFCNIGISYFKLEENPRAHLLMSQCVARSSLDLAFKDRASAVVASIEQTLRAGGHAPVTIKPDPDNATVFVVEFGDESKFNNVATVWLPFGTSHVTAKMTGFETKTVEVTVSDPNPKEVEIKLEPSKIKSDRPITAMKAHYPSIIPPVVASGLTAIAAGVTVAAMIKGRAAAKRSAFALDPIAYDAIESDVSKWNTVLAIGGIASIVGAGVSGFLWYKATRPPTLEVQGGPTAGGAAVSISGRF